MNKTQQTFLHILGSHLNTQPVRCPADTDWMAIVDLARAHSLQAVVYYSLKDVACVPKAALDMLSKAYHSTVFRDAQFDYLKDAISRGLEDIGAEHVFLKGICLKQNYPVSALRSMSDVDILVHTRDYDAIDKVLTGLGGEFAGKDDNQRCYRFAGNVLVELHPCLMHEDSPAAGMNPGWQYTEALEGGCRRVMTEEGFYLYTLCHLAQHLLAGGTGVRSVMDIWVHRHLRHPQPDRAFVEQELNRFGLWKLIENLEDLAEVWFSGSPETDVTRELGAYILTSGTYGTQQRLLLSKAALFGGKWASAKHKLFPSKKLLEGEFPWCAGKGYLLPAAWTARLLHRATHEKGMLLRRWGRENLAQSDEAIEAHRQRLSGFGVKQEKD